MPDHSEHPKNPCLICYHHIADDTSVCMYHSADGHCLYGALKKLVVAGASVGLSIEIMIDLLNSGMTIFDLISYIESLCRSCSYFA